MLKIAITGGIGAGKTAITDYLKYLDFTVIDADVISREMTGPGGCAITAICEKWGSDIANQERGLDRDLMRSIIYSNEESKREFENIVTKSVIKTVARLLKVHELRGSKVVFVAAPLLFECDMQDDYDAVWLVIADKDTRVERVSERDDLGYEIINRIIASQMSDDEKAKLSSDVIENNGTLPELKKNVDKLLNKYGLEA
ncbi:MULTISPECIES: dephospho-CoA kinase [Mogibacterium]|jgi:dephospho-CoA kinase|uniref:dephospho-CoA kinase n=1 Tax=Mogibacterium TaxID=86331 RepID=UPI00027C5A0D|nr:MULTISPECIES: dephospho-CoA kinase [Mogibacterium]EJU19190.1 dephospho-CoA kinase [Mogibacterium sp. CM50]